MSQFDPDDPRVTAYAFGELHGHEKATFEQELAQSSELREAVDATRATADQLQQALREVALNSDKQPTRIESSRDARPTAASRRRRWMLLAAGGGTAVAIALATVNTVRVIGLAKRAGSKISSSIPSGNEAARDTRGRVAVEEALESAARYPGNEINDDKAQILAAHATRLEGAVGQAVTAQPTVAPENRPELRQAVQTEQLGDRLRPAMDMEAVDTSDQDRGRGPGMAGDRFDRIVENPFFKVGDRPLSTFSIDVDTASYSKVRQYLLEHHRLPRADAVRIEELVNYFDYAYETPTGEDPFAANLEVASCPWRPAHRLVRFGLKGKEFPNEDRPPLNLVFLLDVSGSMNRPNKLPMVKRAMSRLVDHLGEADRVAIVVYSGAAGLVLPPTRCNEKSAVLDALERLKSGGSTNGGDGIRLAYQTALDAFIEGGVNRVVLCTDGDFNVGTTGTDELIQLAEQNAKTGVFLSVFGFGMGNHNDAMLEQISNKGNGNYGFIDNDLEVQKVFCDQVAGTLITIAKDVKLQIEFNPSKVAAYRLIGYENRVLNDQDFNDDTKDAGEIGAGHTVTALYEVVPVGVESDVRLPEVDRLKYQRPAPTVEDEKYSAELLTLKIRYKQPDGESSKLLTFPLTDEGHDWESASSDFRFAASVASYGMMLRDSEHRGEMDWGSVLRWSETAADGSDSAYREEFLMLVRRAKSLAAQ